MGLSKFTAENFVLSTDAIYRCPLMQRVVLHAQGPTFDRRAWRDVWCGVLVIAGRRLRRRRGQREHCDLARHANRLAKQRSLTRLQLETFATVKKNNSLRQK